MRSAERLPRIPDVKVTLKEADIGYVGTRATTGHPSITLEFSGANTASRQKAMEQVHEQLMAYNNGLEAGVQYIDLVRDMPELGKIEYTLAAPTVAKPDTQLPTDPKGEGHLLEHAFNERMSSLFHSAICHANCDLGFVMQFSPTGYRGDVTLPTLAVTLPNTPQSRASGLVDCAVAATEAVQDELNANHEAIEQRLGGTLHASTDYRNPYQPMLLLALQPQKEHFTPAELIQKQQAMTSTFAAILNIPPERRLQSKVETLR